MVLAVFRTRTDPNTTEEYGRLAEEMSALARTMPGYISHKGYGAEDGEVLILVEFENEETMKNWGRDPRHLVVQRRGPEFFTEYRLQICNVIRESSHKR